MTDTSQYDPNASVRAEFMDLISEVKALRAEQQALTHTVGLIRDAVGKLYPLLGGIVDEFNANLTEIADQIDTVGGQQIINVNYPGAPAPAAPEPECPVPVAMDDDVSKYLPGPS